MIKLKYQREIHILKKPSPNLTKTYLDTLAHSIFGDLPPYFCYIYNLDDDSHIVIDGQEDIQRVIMLDQQQKIRKYSCLKLQIIEKIVQFAEEDNTVDQMMEVVSSEGTEIISLKTQTDQIDQIFSIRSEANSNQELDKSNEGYQEYPFNDIIMDNIDRLEEEIVTEMLEIIEKEEIQKITQKYLDELYTTISFKVVSIESFDPQLHIFQDEEQIMIEKALKNLLPEFMFRLKTAVIKEILATFPDLLELINT